MADPIADLAYLWKWFAETQCHGYSPLYERIAGSVAEDPDLLKMIMRAPPAAHMPPALLAAVHDLVLRGIDHPLAEVYEGRSEAEPVPLFAEVCRNQRDEILALLATRHIQTNDCGRSAVIGPGLTWLSSLLGEPFALVDVGASAGLNLLCDRYRIDYGEHGVTGPDDSTVRISCRVLGGEPPVARRLPAFASRTGIEHSPIDLTDPEDARWLLACVWPDTGRLERTAASIRLAQEDPPPVIAGDAVGTLPGVLDALGDGTPAVVVTTWAFAYLRLEERRAFAQVLGDASRTRPLAWLSAEGAGTVEAFADTTAPRRTSSGRCSSRGGAPASICSASSTSTATGSTGGPNPADAGRSGRRLALGRPGRPHARPRPGRGLPPVKEAR